MRYQRSMKYKSRILFTGLFLLFLIAYLYLPSIFKEVQFVDDTIQSILQTTPYLWRKSIFNKTESVSSRIESQKLWIQRLSQTEFIKNAQVKTILVQDGMNLYYHTDGQMQCPYAPGFENKCKLVEETWMHLLLGSWRYNGFDAVTGIRNSDIRPYESLVPHSVKQILYMLEPPHIAKHSHHGRNNVLLASYWKGSDIPTPYRQWISNNSQGIDTEKLDKILARKTKMVAAIISNCKGANNRLGFIQELQKYVDVDVYGKCGNLSCPKSKTDCWAILQKEYKFYLAFENSNCVDYITEKFFDNSLQFDLVPIVMGAHPNNYKAEAPPNSYITVEDFESPKELAEYLHLLNSNESLYKEYFKWKGTGYFTYEALRDFFCRACGMLFYGDFVPPPATWNSSAMMWKDVDSCLPHGQWYWRG